MRQIRHSRRIAMALTALFALQSALCLVPCMLGPGDTAAHASDRAAAAEHPCHEESQPGTDAPADTGDGDSDCAPCGISASVASAAPSGLDAPGAALAVARSPIGPMYAHRSIGLRTPQGQPPPGRPLFLLKNSFLI